MSYEEAYPKALSIDELTLMHGFAADVGPEPTADVLMNGYWLRRNSMYPIAESQSVTSWLQIYDMDWKGLVAAGVQPLTENDPRIGSVADDAQLPTFTNLRPSLLFDTREELAAKATARAEAELIELKDAAVAATTQAIGKVGLERVNELLGLIGVRVDETGNAAYDEVSGEQLEGVRQVARMMCSDHRDMVRMNAAFADPADVEAVEGTDIEDPTRRAMYRALLGMPDAEE